MTDVLEGAVGGSSLAVAPFVLLVDATFVHVVFSPLLQRQVHSARDGVTRNKTDMRSAWEDGGTGTACQCCRVSESIAQNLEIESCCFSAG